MTLGFSSYLDALRFLAALIVFMSHLAYQRFTGGSLQGVRDLDIGSDAVVLFFVLSGLVIAFAAERDGTGWRFAFARITRLYSVVLPALGITLILDHAGRALDPQSYIGWWYSPISVAEMLWRGLSFSNQWLGSPVRLGSNGPLWSLSYEAGYYLLFGVALFCKGSLRPVLLSTVLLIVGPAVILLLPAWLAGVLTWRILRTGQRMSCRVAVFSAGFFPVFYVLGHMLGLPWILTEYSLVAADLVGFDGPLGFSHRFLWHNALAFVFGLHLLGMASLLAGRGRNDADYAIRWLAGGSFTIYVLHYPLLQFLHVVLPGDLSGRPAALTSLAMLACFGVAQITERRLPTLRKMLQRSSLLPMRFNCAHSSVSCHEAENCVSQASAMAQAGPPVSTR